MIYEYNGNLIDGLYYFYAGWNGKCQYINDKINKLNSNYPDFPIVKVNTTKNQLLKKQFSVNKIPTFILLNNSKIIKRIDGNTDYYSLSQLIKK